ncbi:hypothetical protein WAI453_010224 [Rhynchosporium graminicola]
MAKKKKRYAATDMDFFVELVPEMTHLKLRDMLCVTEFLIQNHSSREMSKPNTHLLEARPPGNGGTFC